MNKENAFCKVNCMKCSHKAVEQRSLFCKEFQSPISWLWDADVSLGFTDSTNWKTSSTQAG